MDTCWLDVPVAPPPPPPPSNTPPLPPFLLPQIVPHGLPLRGRGCSTTGTHPHPHPHTPYNQTRVCSNLTGMFGEEVGVRGGGKS